MCKTTKSRPKKCGVSHKVELKSVIGGLALGNVETFARKNHRLMEGLS